MDSFTTSLVLIPLIAVAAPVIASLLGRVVRIPLVVFEIILGIVLGPSLLGWVEPTEFTSTLAEFGLALLFFMAGNEIDFNSIKGRPLARAGLGWLISLVGGIAVGILLAPDIAAGVIIGIALGSTALGTIMPILRDAGELQTPFGKAITAVGAAGEFGPLLAISLFLSGRAPGPSALILLGFALIAAAGIFLAARGTHTTLHALITRTLHTSGQFAIRLVILLIAGLVVISIAFGLDILLGAFAAGIMWRLFVSGAEPADQHIVEMKLDGIAFGFLVPIFFINTGITFDLTALLKDPLALALVPVFVILFLLVRDLPGTLAAPPGSTNADKRAILLFSATGLPIIVAVTAIGTESGILAPATAAALVGAGMISVLLFPVLALSQRRISLRDAAERASG